MAAPVDSLSGCDRIACMRHSASVAAAKRDDSGGAGKRDVLTAYASPPASNRFSARRTRLGQLKGLRFFMTRKIPKQLGVAFGRKECLVREQAMPPVDCALRQRSADRSCEAVGLGWRTRIVKAIVQARGVANEAKNLQSDGYRQLLKLSAGIAVPVAFPPLFHVVPDLLGTRKFCWLLR